MDLAAFIVERRFYSVNEKFLFWNLLSRKHRGAVNECEIRVQNPLPAVRCKKDKNYQH